MIAPPTVPPDLLTARIGLKERLLATALDWFLIEGDPKCSFTSTGLVPRSSAALPTLPASGSGGRPRWEGFCFAQKVARLDGRPVDAPTALVRSLGAAFGTLALGLGYFWAAWDADRQGWHDKISGTVVVRTPLLNHWSDTVG